MDTIEFDIEFIAQKVSENPQSPLFARLADLYVRKEQTIEALKICQEGIQLFPQYFSAYIVLGKIHLALKEYSKARDAFQKARQLSPFNPLITKLVDSIPDGPDEPGRTTDENYFSEKNETAASVSDHPNIEVQTPVNQSLFDTLTPDEINYIKKEEEPDSPPDLGYGKPVQQNFSSFDDYFTEQKEENQKNTAISLDDYLQSPAVTAAIDIPAEQVQPEIIEEKITSSPESPQEQSGEAEPAEPEQVFASPEQAALFAEIDSESAQGEDIESLAEKLQSAEKIVPNEEEYASSQPQNEAELPSDYNSDMVTPTLAEIYASQGEYKAAIQAYEILMFSQPENGASYQKRIQELQQLQMEKDGLV
jgi:tetratricopeptide (TPR) repeat protein